MATPMLMSKTHEHVRYIAQWRVGTFVTLGVLCTKRGVKTLSIEM